MMVRLLFYFILYAIEDKVNIFTYRYITEEMEKIDGIFIVGKPEVSVVAIGILYAAYCINLKDVYDIKTFKND